MNRSLNDTDRKQWIDNDEGLYNWWRGSKQSKSDFIYNNKAEIDSIILNVLEGRQPAHYLVYGGN